MRTINKGSEYWLLYDNGHIERPGLVSPSPNWRVTGALERNNFGGIVRRYTLADIIERGDTIPWRFKNGQQRVFVQDFDHGTHREWRSPNYTIR